MGPHLRAWQGRILRRRLFCTWGDRLQAPGRDVTLRGWRIDTLADPCGPAAPGCCTLQLYATVVRYLHYTQKRAAEKTAFRVGGAGRHRGHQPHQGESTGVRLTHASRPGSPGCIAC